jgi:hypothetical protein
MSSVEPKEASTPKVVESATSPSAVPEASAPTSSVATTPPKTSKLTLTLRVSTAPSAVGAALSAELTLANTGPEPVVVNGRLAENTPHAPDPYREVTFELEGPDGKPLSFGPKIRIGAPQPSDAREIAPGASIKHSYDLARLYDLKKPGNYRVRAFYASAPLIDARERPVWTEQVEAAWVTFTRR